MAETKRDRQKAQRQARLAREAAAAKAAAARRRAIRLVVITLAVVGLVAFITTRGDDDSSDLETAAPTTTAVPDASSAAGKPCVALADPLPAGAPAVPVKVGPPPAQLVKEDLKEGTGATVAANGSVTVNYIGVSCSTGKIFDSSYSSGKPLTIPLNQVVKGWTDGIPGMKVGGQRLLGIPPDQGYGSQGRPGIAPDETLWFVVEMIETKAG